MDRDAMMLPRPSVSGTIWSPPDAAPRHTDAPFSTTPLSLSILAYRCAVADTLLRAGCLLCSHDPPNFGVCS